MHVLVVNCIFMVAKKILAEKIYKEFTLVLGINEVIREESIDQLVLTVLAAVGFVIVIGNRKVGIENVEFPCLNSHIALSHCLLGYLYRE